MKVVLDTNVLYAAYTLDRGMCARILRSVIAGHELVLSEYILTELERHLRGKGRLTEAKVEEVTQSLRQITLMIVSAAVPPAACRDPNDLPILGTAIAGGAQVLVTGDADLLILGSYQVISILSPRQFHDRFLAGGTGQAQS